MNSKHAMRHWGVLLLLAAAGLAACGDDDGASNPPTTGSLQVATATSGAELDPDGYTVTVDGTDQAIGVNGSVTYSSLAPNTYTVTLSGVAANCTVQGGNTQQATVVAGQTADVSFAVTCASTVGDLEISTVTTGENLDPDGYSFSVDGGASTPIGINETVTLSGLPEGTYSVELSGVANNCQLGGANPRDVSVLADDTGSTTFSVTCVAITGDLSVVTFTTGDEVDPDGYTVSLDGGVGQAMTINDTLDIVDLAPGDYSVSLAGLAGNCSLVSGDNPRTVTVTAEAVTETTFEVACVSTVGDLRVITSTTGVNLDPDGYNLVLDGGAPTPIGTNDQTTFANLAVGDHTIGLFSLAGNCRIEGDETRTVQITGGVVEETFDVSCFTPLQDKIVFHSNRAGGPEYEIWVMDKEGTNAERLTSDPELDLEPAVSPDGLLIAFWSRRGGSSDVWVIGADGSGPANLTNLGGQATEPAWSPDGTQIAFSYRTSSTSSQIWAIGADGQGLRRLSLDGQAFDDFQPAWSPDGTTIVFTSNRTGDDEVFTMSSVAGGSGTVTNLTNDPGRDGRAQYSPDGTQIVFDAKRDGIQPEIFIMNADGTGQTALTADPANDYHPTFSPDGTRIAFTSERAGQGEIYEMNTDGTGLTRLTINAAGDGSPDYSP